jgi:hypothetical protein
MRITISRQDTQISQQGLAKSFIRASDVQLFGGLSFLKTLDDFRKQIDLPDPDAFRETISIYSQLVSDIGLDAKFPIKVNSPHLLVQAFVFLGATPISDISQDHEDKFSITFGYPKVGKKFRIYAQVEESK